MFEHLHAYSRIVVTGPQRSGTTIAAKMIAADTGHAYIDEQAFGVYDIERFWKRLRFDNVVVQAPAMFAHLMLVRSAALLLVVVRRDLAEIHASQERIGWDGELAERVALGIDSDSATEKYRRWDAERPAPSVEIAYPDLAGHRLWVPAEQRVHFAAKQTA